MFTGAIRQIPSNWLIFLDNGKIQLDIGGSRQTASTLINNNAWRHISVVLPVGSSSASDVSIYVDGIAETVTYSHDHAFPVGLAELVCGWMPATYQQQILYGMI